MTKTNVVIVTTVTTIPIFITITIIIPRTHTGNEMRLPLSAVGPSMSQEGLDVEWDWLPRVLS